MVKKHSSAISVWAFIIPLVIAFAAIAIIVQATKQTQQTASKASYDPLAQCISVCDTIPNTKYRSACKLKCPKLVSGEIGCKEACGGTNTCIQTCNNVLDPCSASFCAGTAAYKASCVTACNNAKNDTQTCAEAFTQNPAFSNVPAPKIAVYTAKCTRLFE